MAYGITWPESEEKEETFVHVVAMNLMPPVASLPSLGGGTSK
jgi:hypothetical protein